MYLSLTRFCFIVPHAFCVGKERLKILPKKIHPTYLNFFEHVTLAGFRGYIRSDDGISSAWKQ